MLHPDPSLAEVPDFSKAQLEDLTRSVELKKQKLEDDINAYIRRKQEELSDHEQELLRQYRSMESAGTNRSDNCHVPSNGSAANPVNTPSNPLAPSAPPAEQSGDSTEHGAETAKRQKHTRVHKREKELWGLVTPVFLPLLEAPDTSPAKKKEKKRLKEEKVERSDNSAPTPERGSPSMHAEKSKENRRTRSKSREGRMEPGESSTVATDEPKEKQKAESGKKSKHHTKKSSLRLNSTPKARRKRVSLVIDDQVVFPADNIAEPPLTSPTETAISTASNSTASIEDAIDPRLIHRNDTPMHQDPVHHSIPLPTHLPSTSPTKHTGHILSESPALANKSLPAAYDPIQTTSRTLSSTSKDIVIPQHASSSPIYADAPNIAEQEEEDFSTYVGGISGSGADDVDQAGSYGYPSSLGASYMESYMQNRPLSVRIAAAEKAELKEDEKKRLLGAGREKEDFDVEVGHGEDRDDDDGMDVMGSMEGF